MSRATLEVADIIRAAGDSFWDKQGSHLAWPHRKVLDAILRCRTATLGGHRDQCIRCGYQAISYNSCRNRSCPKCQGNARAKWLQARSASNRPRALWLARASLRAPTAGCWAPTIASPLRSSGAEAAARGTFTWCRWPRNKFPLRPSPSAISGSWPATAAPRK